MGSTLVRTNMHNIPLTILNTGDEPRIIRKGTTLGVMKPIADVYEDGCPDDDSRIPSLSANVRPVPPVTPLVSAYSKTKSAPVDELPAHLTPLMEGLADDLSAAEVQELRLTLNEFADVFSSGADDQGSTSIVTHSIDTGDARPVRIPPRRSSIAKHEIEKQEIRKMLDRGVIEPSSSPWASPVVLVSKKDGSTRFCIDYRKLNDVTRKDAYPLPRIDETLDSLSNCKYFSTLDLLSGYWQVKWTLAIEKNSFHY